MMRWSLRDVGCITDSQMRSPMRVVAESRSLEIDHSSRTSILSSLRICSNVATCENPSGHEICTA